MHHHEKINYLEMPARDIAKAKTFFQQVFGWSFEDYGPEYVALADAGIDGGFYLSELTMSAAAGSALVVLYSEDLDATAAKIVAAGGEIVKPVFAFPGGRRFHFSDTNQNEYAVWSDK